METRVNPSRARAMDTPHINQPLLPYILAAVGIFLALWTIFEVIGGAGSDLAVFITLITWFSLGAGVYLSRCGTDLAAWCSIPVILTVLGILGYVVIPVGRVLSGNDVIDADYLHAMTIATVGFMSFWIVSWIANKHKAMVYTPEPFVSNRTIYATFFMFVVGTAASFALWKSGLYSYTADSLTRGDALPVMQWAMLLAYMLRNCLIVSCIAMFGVATCTAGMKLLFWCSFTTSFLFGLISGMKSGIMQPFFIVAVIYILVRQRIPRSAVLAIPLFLLIVYPFVNAYRATLNAGYRYQVNSIEGLKETLAQSIGNAFEKDSNQGHQTLRDTIDAATERVSLLSDIQKLVSLPDPSILNGEEKVYLAPIYPFIPRALWKDKPILNKGQRLTMALGGGVESSTAVTWIGDMWVLGGLPGVVFGMALFGLALQLFVNLMQGKMNSQRMFFYIVMALELCEMERDTTYLISYATQVAVTYLLLSWFVYGGKPWAVFGARHDVAA